MIVKNRLLYVENIGWFIIISTGNESDGNIDRKSIIAYSYEYSLNARGAGLLDGYYKFYDPISYAENPDGTKSLIHKFLEQNQTWKVGHIDPDLWARKRYLNDIKGMWYGFLMSDVEKAYECIFEFDTELQTISAYLPKNIIKETDISLSFDNLIKSIKIDEVDETITTALAVYGGGLMDIRSVNPLGTPYIYNFEYYKDINWMSQNLINAINVWEAKVQSYLNNYGILLTSLKDENAILLSLQIELTDLRGKHSALLLVQQAQMTLTDAAGQSAYQQTVSQINALVNQINQKVREIETKQLAVNKLTDQVVAINVALRLANNFTTEQLNELSCFIYEGEYTNEYYIQTDILTYSEIQEISLELYQQGLNVLNKCSKPNYTFSMSSANFLFIKEFNKFTEQLELGAMLNVNYKEEDYFYPVLLEVDFSFDNPKNFNMTFGTRFRLDTSEFIFADLNNQQNKASTNTISNSSIWGLPVKSGLVDDVTEYMSNALNLATQEIINSKNQEIIQGEYGIRIRRALSEGDQYYDPNEVKYDSKQSWIHNKGIGYTTDNWQTTGAIFGEVTNIDGSKSTGVIGNSIVGKILASNQLIITNENSSFIFDGSGASLTNASITMTSNNSRILLDPSSTTNGIKIQTRTGIGSSTWTDKFYVDTSGNLIIDGRLTVSQGSTIAGWSILSDRLQNSTGYVGMASATASNQVVFWAGSSSPTSSPFRVYANGDLYANSGTFNGTIQASNLSGLIQSTQIGSVNANTITAGTMSADRIYGGTISSVNMIYFGNNRGYVGQTGLGTIELNAYGTTLTLSSNSGINLAGNTFVSGTLGVSGAKPAVVDTQNFGKRLLYSYETPDSLFGDFGEDKIYDGICKIDIDPIFKETINIEMGYIVFLTKYGQGDIRLSERNPDYFIIEGDNDIEFSWQIVARRLNYENVRLKQVTVPDFNEVE